jgi:hypothetical protein
MAQPKRMSGDNSDSLLNGVNHRDDNTRKKAGVESGLRVMNLASNQSTVKQGQTKNTASNKVRPPTNSEIESF